MTIQEAANEILKEVGKPISAKEIARIALDKRKVSSSAQDPIQSHAQTIEKNIRDEVYNKPKLIFIHSARGRLIGLPGWKSNSSTSAKFKADSLGELRAYVPTELLKNIRLAEQAKLKNTFDETVSLILTKGLSVLSKDIEQGVVQQLNSLKSLK
jgi:hypothetical protein